MVLAVVTDASPSLEEIFRVFVHSDVIVATVGMLVASALDAVVSVVVVTGAERFVVVQRFANIAL